MHTDELITEIPTLGKATLPSPLQKRADETVSISFAPCPHRFKKEPMKRLALVLFQIKVGLSLK
jgi:hypothetical protein